MTTLQGYPVFVRWGKMVKFYCGIMPLRILLGLKPDVIGSNLRSLHKRGWFVEWFSAYASSSFIQAGYEDDSSTYWFNLHKTVVDVADESTDGCVIVLENIADVQVLEDGLMHSERLALIGRLAAGVTHEVGNPVTGIAVWHRALRCWCQEP